MPFKDDKPKDAENTGFQAGSDNTPMANHWRVKRSAAFVINSYFSSLRRQIFDTVLNKMPEKISKSLKVM